MNASTSSSLAFTDQGAGEPLVLVHAFPLDARMWSDLARDLASSARVIAPDLRGFGRSSALPPAASVDAHADDVAALLDRLAIPRATVVGSSMGGYVALALVRRHPSRVARLALADSRLAGDTSEGRQARDENIALVRREGTAPLVERMLPKLLSPEAPPPLVARVRAMGIEQPPEGVAAALAAMRDRPDATELARSLRIPLSIVTGEADTFCPPADARAMAAVNPGAALEILEGAGHLSHLEALAPFAAAIRRLLMR